jgi:hypothetical protein
MGCIAKFSGLFIFYDFCFVIYFLFI